MKFSIWMLRLKTLTIAVILSLTVITVIYAVTASDDFDRSDNTDLGASWDVLNVAPAQIVGQKVRAGALGGADEIEMYNAISPGADQRAQITISTWGGGGLNNIGVGLHLSSSPTGYYCIARNGTVTSRISRINGTDDFTTLAEDSSVTWSSGDVLYCEVVSNQITMKRGGPSGTTVATVSDSTYSTGNVGLQIFTNGVLSDVEGDNWSGGDVPSGITVRHRPVVQ